MIKNYSLDFYTENSSESLPILIDIDNDKDELQFLYKLFCICVNSLFLEYVSHNALFYQFKDLFGVFDIYLNRIDSSGNAEPIFCNSDEDINQLLYDFDFTIEDSATNRPIILSTILQAMIKNNHTVQSINKQSSNKLKLRYGYISVVPKPIYRILCEPVEINLIHNYNIANLSNEFLFICSQTFPAFINKGFMYNNINKIKIIYEDLTKLIWFIRTTLNKIYNKKLMHGVYKTAPSLTTTFTGYSGGRHVAQSSTVMQQINSFPQYCGGLHKPLIIPVDDEVVFSDEDVKSIEESAKQILKQIDEENENE